MLKRELKTPDIAKMAKLPVSTIKNILNGKSKKLDHIQKISAALDAPIEYFTIPLEVTCNSTDVVDLTTFQIASQITLNQLLEENITTISIKLLNDLALSVYSLLIENKDNQYAKGFISAKIESLEINK